MKTFILTTLLTLSSLAHSASITGVITSNKKSTDQTLFIFAKKYNSQMPMPLMVKKIVSPRFPLTFSLSEADKMIKSMPLQAPFEVTVRVSPSGSPMDKSGVQVKSKKPVNFGDELNLSLSL